MSETDDDGDRSHSDASSSISQQVPSNSSAERLSSVSDVPTTEEPSVTIQNQPEPSTAINPVDDENQFIYDADLNKLVCVGSNFDDIPLSVVHTFSLKTKILDLSGNRFQSLGCIKNFPNLEELFLDNNQIDDGHTRFPKLPKLHTLMLNKNHLQDIYKLVEQLRHAYPLLTHLSLLGNEACPIHLFPGSQSPSETILGSFAQARLDEEYQRYRHLLIFRLPTLRFLDSREISANERRIATQLGDILYSIGETKSMRSSLPVSEEDSNNQDFYSPLPEITSDNKRRTSLQKVRHSYHGEGSQGNKFVKDDHL